MAAHAASATSKEVSGLILHDEDDILLEEQTREISHEGLSKIRQKIDRAIEKVSEGQNAAVLFTLRPDIHVPVMRFDEIQDQ